MSEYIPDHPTIANLERTGDPYGRATVEPICPVCKKPCDTIYEGPNGTVGCDNCIHTRDAWEVPECLERE